LTFAVASSPTSLSNPDIDSGLGSPVPFSEEAGPQTSFTYTFTSAAAAKTPGTVYWQASFSTSGIEPCAGSSPSIFRTAVRALTVVQAPVQVSIDGPSSFRGAHPTIVYGVDCSISCTGDTYYQAFALQRKSTARRVPSLDFGPTPVSITAGTAGNELFAWHYSGRALRTLDKIIRGGEIVEIKLSVKVADASGNVARAHETDRLLP